MILSFARGPAVAALVAALVLLATTFEFRAVAGHMIGNGDCWRVGTPVNCRLNYAGQNTVMMIRLVDQLNDSVIAGQVSTGASNWTSSSGPQSFSWSARTGDSLVYVNQDWLLGAPNGYVINYNSSGQACSSCWVSYSHIWLAHGNRDHPLGTAVAAHELGHTLLLDHHSSETVLMTQGTTLTSPQAIDIGPLPVCSGINDGYMGVRCIYNWNF